MLPLVNHSRADLVLHCVELIVASGQGVSLPLLLPRDFEDMKGMS